MLNFLITWRRAKKKGWGVVVLIAYMASVELVESFACRGRRMFR